MRVRPRSFTYVEVAFFSRWWRAQRAPRRRAVAALVQQVRVQPSFPFRASGLIFLSRQGRLEFANGGWCMHDEAAASFSDMIDQTTLGHTWLARTLNTIARVGWQIDPFGHTALAATLLGPAVGFEGVFMGRADYADLEARAAQRALEFRWRPSEDAATDDDDDDVELLGGGSGGGAASSAASSFLGLILGSGNYGAPPGFDWDVSRDPPINDDPLLEGYNAPAIVDAFVNTTLVRPRADARRDARGESMQRAAADATRCDVPLPHSCAHRSGRAASAARARAAT